MVRAFLTTAATSALLFACNAAVAQTAQTPASSPADAAPPSLTTPSAPAESVQTAPRSNDATSVQEVVVTAERRSVNLQRSAVAATVLTSADLANRNIVTVDDLQFSTPSLSVQNFGQGNEFNIRGIGKSESNIQTPSGTVTYRDGVATFGGFFQDEPFYDLEGIEVLRGPQGTFAGQNATGGAVFIREKNPSLTAGYTGYGQVGFGNYSDYLLQGASNLPITDTLAARVAFNAESRDSFFHVTGPYTGNPGNLQEFNGRISLLWRPSQQLEVVGKVDVNYINQGGYPAGTAVGPNSTASHPFDISSDARLSGTDAFLRTVLQATYTFDSGIALHDIVGYQVGKTQQDTDLDGTAQAVPVPLPAKPAILTPETFVAGATETIYSEEFNIVSPSDQRFTWVLGAFYQLDTTKIPFGSGFNAGEPPGIVNILTVNTSPKNSAAGFGQVTYAITPKLELQLGARYTASDFRQKGAVIIQIGGVNALVLPVPGYEKDSKLTGKIALNYTLDSRNFLYAFVATGHKSGGINGAGSFTNDSPPPNFRPEDVVDYELGWKSSFFGRHLLTQIGGFYDDYKRFQLDFIQGSSQIDQIQNVLGTTTTGGIEAQLQGSFGNFSFNINAAYLHSSLGNLHGVDFRFNAASINCDPATGPTVGSCQSLAGKDLPNAPEFTFNTGGQYAFHTSWGGTFTPRLDYAYQDRQEATAFAAAPLDRLAARNIFKAEVNYDQGLWRATAYATNLTNDTYLVSTNHVLAYPGAPRQYGLKLTRNF